MSQICCFRLLAVAILLVLGQLVSRGRAEDPPFSTDYADVGRAILAVPPNANLKKSLSSAEDAIKTKDWSTAAEVLQGLLEMPSDYFVMTDVTGPDGKPTQVRAGMKYCANRLLGTLPAEGRAVYQKKFGEEAEKRLAKAEKDGDKALFAEIAYRYLWTDAGPKAAERLGCIALDRGEFMMAAQAFDRLVQRQGGMSKLEPLTLFRLALVYEKSGTKDDREKGEEAWKELTRKAPKGLRIGDRDANLDELKKQIEKLPEIPERSFFEKGGFLDKRWRDDSLIVGGETERGNAETGAPTILQPIWRKSLRPDRQDYQWQNDLLTPLLKALEDQKEPALSASRPGVVVVGIKGVKRPIVYYRDLAGVCGALLDTDRALWDTPSQRSLMHIRRDPTIAPVVNNWFERWQKGEPRALIENATFGQLSTDGKRVYAIEDFAVPFLPEAVGGRLRPELKDQLNYNRLRPFGADSGLLLWELGGNLPDGEKNTDAKDFRNTHFLGAPLCLDGKIYFLNEKNQEIRLVCIEPEKIPRRPFEKDILGAVAWIEPLCKVKSTIAEDYRRRIGGAQPVCSQGILVCPTNAGVVVGVDLASHRIEWAYPYKDAALKKFEEKFGDMPPLTWRSAAPVISGDRVVFTAPDADKLHCLALKNGEAAWTMKREEKDLFLGGVFDKRVLVVSKTHVRALALADGKELWKVETGLPSGTGAASDGIYYLPLKEYGADKEKSPTVLGIDLKTGKVVSVIRHPKGAALGNFVFAEGHLIAQSPTEIVVYPLVKKP